MKTRLKTAAFLGLDRDLKNSEVLLRRFRTSGRANVASFVLIDERGSPRLGELAEVLKAVVQAPEGLLKPGGAINVFLSAWKAGVMAAASKGAAFGGAATPIEWSSRR
eukprot:14020358-Ditylum_brightwellii.AAC.1